jgi:tetratricopeptide (TPR) repeat protein
MKKMYTTPPAILYTLWGCKDDDSSQILSGDYEAALSGSFERLCSTSASGQTPRELVDSIKEVCNTAAYESDALHELAVAALLLHMQHNVFGPYESSSCPSSPPSPSSSSLDLVNELAENGEDVVGIVFHPEYLLVAKLAFNALASSHPSPAVSFWNFRVAAAVQYLLTERSQVLLDTIQETVIKLEHAYALDEAGKSTQEQQALLAAVHVEAANIFSVFGMVKEMKEHVEKAQNVLGMTASLTGRMGTRTVHQQDAHAQLVAKVTVSDDGCPDSVLVGHLKGAALDDLAFNLVTNQGDDTDGSTKNSEFRGFESDSDVFRGGPRLLEHEESMRTDLNAMHQLVILALCNVVKKSSSPDGTQPWELTAYAECVLAQDNTEFLTRISAYMELSRLEIQRSRTRERALCSMEGIKEALSMDNGPRATAAVAPEDRARYAFTIKCPPRASLWKELGEAFVACGLIGAAIKLFEEAELWDSLIVCYQLLQKNEIAEQLVRTRLEVTPNDARLWCTLGDLVDSDEHYHTAWARSGGRSARSQRSLARSAMRRDDFALASDCWERALALSPLHLEAWFSLGWCNLKSQNYEKAATALTRLVQMDPDDGRAWNNLATVHMKMENWPEALVAFGEASKHSRETWQTWENYAHVAFQVGDLNTSARALEHMISLTRGETYNPKLVQCLVESLKTVELEPKVQDAPAPNNSIVTSTEQQLYNYVANILKKIAASSKGSAGPGFWKTYAMYYAITGAASSEAECLMKHVRGLSTATWHAQDDLFDEYAQSCVALARAHLAPPVPAKSGLSQSRMLLRNALQRSRENFEDSQGYADMEQAFEDVCRRLDVL